MPSRGDNRTFIGAFLIALFVLANGMGTAAGSEVTSLRPLIRAGEKAPSFTLSTVEGKTVSFRPGDGKPALVVFWSAFCPLCRELAPGVNDLFRKHGKEIRFLGVNLDGKRFSNAVRSFVEEFRLTFPVGLDDIRNDFFIAADPYGISKTPTAVLVDGAGRVRGAYAADEMRGLLQDFDRIISEIQ